MRAEPDPSLASHPHILVAGNAFTSSLLSRLHHDGQLSLDEIDKLTNDDVHDGLHSACRVAAMTCAQAGSNPPLRSELAS